MIPRRPDPLPPFLCSEETAPDHTFCCGDDCEPKPEPFRSLCEGAQASMGQTRPRATVDEASKMLSTRRLLEEKRRVGQRSKKGLCT